MIKLLDKAHEWQKSIYVFMSGVWKRTKSQIS